METSVVIIPDVPPKVVSFLRIIQVVPKEGEEILLEKEGKRLWTSTSHSFVITLKSQGK